MKTACKFICLTGLFLMGFSHANSEQKPQRLELRGVLEIGDNFYFSLQFADSKSGWLNLGATYKNVKLLAYDPDKEQLQIDDMGQFKILSIKQADEIPVAVTMSMKESGNAEENLLISVEDIDPYIPGKQSLNQLKGRLKYPIGREATERYHTSTSSSINTAVDDSTTNSRSNSASTSGKASVDGDELSEAEVIALQTFEKHNVPTREPPRDVIIKYPISPRSPSADKP